MPDPRTPEQYVDLIEQAIFEIDDLLACAQDEGDSDYQLSEMPPIYERLQMELKNPRSQVVNGEYSEYARGSDLSFMSLVNKWKLEIPF